MCGRIAWVFDAKLAKWVKGFEVAPGVTRVLEKKRYNIPPTAHIPVAMGDEIVVARWGFPVPKNPAGAFNTRIESAAKSTLWAPLLDHGRALVAVTGFYEWQRTGATKVPHFITRDDGEPMVLAALAGVRRVAGSHELCTSIVTCAPSDQMAPIHDRMPVILAPEDAGRWLHAPTEEAITLARPTDGLAMHAVGNEVNSTAADHAGLLAPRTQAGLDRFFGQSG